MEVQRLRYFLALAEELNFTRAAARCWVSQQALSQAVARLERELGLPLVVRRPGGCTLTPAGHLLVTSARRVVAAVDAVQPDLASALAELPTHSPAPDRRTDGELRIGLLLDGLGPATTALVQGFRAAMPSVRLRVGRVEPQQIADALTEARVDVVLAHGPMSDPRIESHPLFAEPRLAVLSRADERADADVLTAADLLRLAARERVAGIDPDWEAFFMLGRERGGEPERRGGPAESIEDLLWSIALDRLFLTVPRHLADTYPGEFFDVRYVPVPDLEPVVFSVCCRTDDRRPVVRCFRELARTIVPARSGGPLAPPAGPARRP